MKPTFFTILLMIAMFYSCKNESDMTDELSGKEYEVVVVMNNIAWDGTIGTMIREELTSPLPFLQHTESSMKIQYTVPEQFDESTKNARNILIVNIDKMQYPTVSFKKKSGKWSENQVILYLNAPDEQALVVFLKDNHNIILDNFTNEEWIRARKYLAKNHSQIVSDLTKKKFDITFFSPKEIISYKDTVDCLWFSNNASVGRCDFLIYSFQYDGAESLTLENLIAKRDSITKLMIPGFIQNTYMITNKNNINFAATTLHGKYCVIIRGLWQLYGAENVIGPFVSYARADELNKRVIVSEGFVYEPVQENRNFIRNLEGSLQTVKFSDEEEVGN
jgi:hypothetical protein